MQPTPLAAARRFTLAELTVVLLIVAATAGIAGLMLSGTVEKQQEKAVEEVSFVAFQRAIESYRDDMKGLRPPPDDGLPTKLLDLWVQPAVEPGFDPTYDPALKRGWNGPYLVTNGVIPSVTEDAYAKLEQGGIVPTHFRAGDPVVLDAYGRPYVWLSGQVVSAGPDGVLTPILDPPGDDLRSGEFQ